jgi:hypothetical protein
MVVAAGRSIGVLLVARHKVLASIAVLVLLLLQILTSSKGCLCCLAHDIRPANLEWLKAIWSLLTWKLVLMSGGLRVYVPVSIMSMACC